MRFLERVSYAGTKLDAVEIAADLRERFAARTGWGSTDEAAPPAEAPEATTQAAMARRAAV